MSQQQGNDLASNDSTPPQSTSNPQQGSTIEDKLNNILFELAQLVGENSSIYKNLQRNIQAIITTETTNARINTLQELQPCDDHYDSKAVHLEDITAHIAALQEEQL